MARECRPTWDDDQEFIEKTIRFWVHDARAKGGCLSEADAEDLAQNIRIDLLRRLCRFDPAKSSRRTFIALLIEHRVRSLSEEARVIKRGYGCPHVSLDEPLNPSSDESPERHETISQDDYLSATCRSARTGEELGDLIIDLQLVEKVLTEREVELFRHLQEVSVTEAAAAMRIPRTTVQDMVRRIGWKLARAGIEKYFRVSPSSRERFR